MPIAFEYGWLAKGVYFSPKVAYDERYAGISPGQLLRAALIERFQQDGSCRSIDYLGPSSRATADWGTQRYTISRVLIPTSRVGRFALAAYERLHPLIGRLRSRATTGAAAPAPNAADTTEDDAELAPRASIADEPLTAQDHAGLSG